MEGFLKNSINKSRLMALALLAGMVALVFFAAVMPLLKSAADYRETIQDLEFKLQRFRKIAAEKDYWLAHLEEIKHEGEQEEHFIARNTAALASADLQSKIKEVITVAGGELISTQVIPEHKEDQFTRIAIKVRMTGSTDMLRQVLYAFESQNPILFVENLNLRPIRIAQPQGPNSKQQRIADRLSVDFDVVGYMRAG